MEIIDPSFRDELATLINRHSMENGSNTPDFVLADYLCDCLRAFNAATKGRTNWYGEGEHEHRVLNCEEPGLPIFPKPFES